MLDAAEREVTSQPVLLDGGNRQAVALGDLRASLCTMVFLECSLAVPQGVSLCRRGPEARSGKQVLLTSSISCLSPTSSPAGPCVIQSSRKMNLAPQGVESAALECVYSEFSSVQWAC